MKTPFASPRLSALFVRGTQDGGELATAKHFPGTWRHRRRLARGTCRSSAPTSARLDSVELVPFKAAIEAGAVARHDRTHRAAGDPRRQQHAGDALATHHHRAASRFARLPRRAITDAMTMEGIGKGYTTEQSSVLAVKAGADILLKPSDPRARSTPWLRRRARRDHARANRQRRAPRARAQGPRWRCAERRAYSLERSCAMSSARPSIALIAAERRAAFALTLLRDRDATPCPIAANGARARRPVRAGDGDQGGQSFEATSSAGARKAGARHRRRADRAGRDARSARFARIASPMRDDGDGDRGVRATREGQGRVAIPQPIATWIDEIAHGARPWSSLRQSVSDWPVPASAASSPPMA